MKSNCLRILISLPLIASLSSCATQSRVRQTQKLHIPSAIDRKLASSDAEWAHIRNFLLPPEFPEERDYDPRETGYEQYGARSIHGTKKVVLTFDDGPHPARTPAILDILKRYNVKATFFILTEKVNAQTRPILRRMVEEGHIIGSHDHIHRNNNEESEATFKAELRRSLELVHATLQRHGSSQREIYYRFPYAAYGRRYDYNHLNAIRELSYDIFSENCINFAFWNMDSLDWVPSMEPADLTTQVRAHFEGGSAWTWGTASGGRLIRRPIVIRNPPRGGVVLMHDIQARTVTGLPAMLNYFRDNQIEVVPLNSVEEYAFTGKKCEWR